MGGIGIPVGKQGVRRPDGTAGETLQAGEYAYHSCDQLVAACRKGDLRMRRHYQKFYPQGLWLVALPPCEKHPNPMDARIDPRRHKVEVHEDGTITVTPSIMQQMGDGEVLWHGFLTKGVWTIA